MPSISVFNKMSRWFVPKIWSGDFYFLIIWPNYFHSGISTIQYNVTTFESMAIDPSSFFLYSSTDFRIFKCIFEIFYSIMSNFYMFWIIKKMPSFLDFNILFKELSCWFFIWRRTELMNFFIPNMMIYGDFSIFHQIKSKILLDF